MIINIPWSLEGYYINIFGVSKNVISDHQVYAGNDYLEEGGIHEYIHREDIPDFLGGIATYPKPTEESHIGPMGPLWKQSQSISDICISSVVSSRFCQFGVTSER